MRRLPVAFVGLRTDEDGQTFVEYALILGAVAVGFGLTFASLGPALTNATWLVSNAITGA